MSEELDRHLVAYEGETIYDFDNRILLGWYAQRILELAKGSPSLLELGLGHGYAANVLAGHFPRHAILEGSPAVIARFCRRHPGFSGEIIKTYFEAFLSQDRFDTIVMGFVLEHVADPQALLRKFSRLLTPAGRLFVAVPNAEAMNRRLGHLAGLLPDLNQLSQNDLDLGHRRFYTVESLREEILAAGGRLLKMEGIYLKPLTTAQLLSLGLGDRILEALCRLGMDYPELCCGLLAEVAFE